MTEAGRYHKIDHIIDSNDGTKPNLEVGESSTDGVVFLSSADPSSSQQHDPDAVQRRQRQWTIALFSITTVLLFADQNIMSPNLTEIARYFEFDDRNRDKKLGGDIALAFFVIGAPASFVVGSLGDLYNRSVLFALSVGIAEFSCLATFFVTTYPQFYACRAITGFGLGGALPLIFSVLGDLYTAQDRHFVNAIVGIGTGIGISLGQGVAGFLGPTFGWRIPFLIISVPALVCAALVLFTVQDPERGAMEETVLRNHHQSTSQYNVEDVTSGGGGGGGGGGGLSVEMAPLQTTAIAKQNDRVERETLVHDGSSSSLTTSHSKAPSVVTTTTTATTTATTPSLAVYWHTFYSLVSTPTVVLTLLQGASGCVPWGIVNSFLNDYMAEDRGMTVEAATTTILVFGLGNFFGLLLGGYGGTYLYGKDKRYPALLAGGLAIGACFPFWMLLNAVDSDSNPLFIVVVALSAGVLSGGTGPIVKATLQNVTLPQTRGQAFALFNTFDDFGRGLGPVFIVWLIDNFGGRENAFNIGVVGWMLCGAVNLCIYLTVAEDEHRVQQILTANLSASDR